MTRSLRRALLVALASLACAPVASAAPVSWAFSDSTPVQPSLLQGEVTVLRDTDCLLPAARATGLGLPAALANARTMLVRFDGQGALRRYASSPDARTYGRAMQAAVEAMLKARPDAALAALLRARALAPHDPRPLIDASVLLTRDGLPNEALALLQAAARMHMPPRSPYGISRRAELANDQGYQPKGRQRA